MTVVHAAPLPLAEAITSPAPRQARPWPRIVYRSRGNVMDRRIVPMVATSWVVRHAVAINSNVRIIVSVSVHSSTTDPSRWLAILNLNYHYVIIFILQICLGFAMERHNARMAQTKRTAAAPGSFNALETAFASLERPCVMAGTIAPMVAMNCRLIVPGRTIRTGRTPGPGSVANLAR